MARDKAYASVDYTEVEPLLVRSSGGSNPQAAVAWSELESAIADFADEAALERAIASLFHDVLLTGGITEQRAAIEGSDLYYFTRFEINLPALTGNQLWATRRITDDALLDANGNQIAYSYNFKVTGDGLFTVEFQSASSNPVVADDQYTLIIQRRPTLSRPSESVSVVVPAGSFFNFDNGVILEVFSDGSYMARNSAGANLLAEMWKSPRIKASKNKGIVIIGDDGEGYYRHDLTPTGILDPVLITAAEYDAF